MRNYRSSPTLTNCTFSGNSSNYSGGMYNRYYSSPRLTNCTYSDVEGGWPGTGNIDNDPCFVQLEYWDANGLWVEGDYHLLRTSPCVDAANDANVYTDIEGNPRPFDFPGVDNNGERPEFDMGAYELTPIQAQMQFTPQTLNCKSKGKFVKAHITLPEGISPEDVDVNTPAVAELMHIESEYLEAFVNDSGLVEIEIVFDRQSFCSDVPDTNDGYLEVTVIGSLTTGQYFYSTDTIRIMSRR